MPSSAHIVTSGTPLESSRQGLFNRLRRLLSVIIMIKRYIDAKSRKNDFFG